jgi:hypothetical protein
LTVRNEIEKRFVAHARERHENDVFVNEIVARDELAQNVRTIFVFVVFVYEFKRIFAEIFVDWNDV